MRHLIVLISTMFVAVSAVAQVNTEELISSAQFKNESPQQKAAFYSVLDTYAKDRTKVPASLSKALAKYLESAASSPLTQLPIGGCSRNSTELPLKISLDYSHHVSEQTLKRLAERSDICYDARTKAVNDLPTTSSELLVLGRNLMVKEASDDRAVAVVALTRLPNYPHDIADFLIGQMGSKQGRVPMRLKEPSQVEKAFKYASIHGKTKLMELVKSGELPAVSNLK